MLLILSIKFNGKFMFLDELQALTDKGEGGMDFIREYNVTTKQSIIY